MNDAHDDETDAAAAPADAPSLSVDIRRGDPTAEELAAVIAVVSESYAAEAAASVAAEPRVRDGWSITQRGMRQPLPRELGWARALR